MYFKNGKGQDSKIRKGIEQKYIATSLLKPDFKSNLVSFKSFMSSQMVGALNYLCWIPSCPHIT